MSRPKKILIVNFEYPPLGGGGGVATKQMAEQLAKTNEVHVITTWFEGLKRQEEIGGVNIRRVKVWGRKQLPTASLLSLVTFVPVSLVAGLIICWRHKFDVINAQFVVPSGVTALILAKIFHCPFVLSFIGGDLFDPTKGTSPHRHAFMRALIRLVAKGADARTAISYDTKKRAQDLHGVKEEIKVVHIGLSRIKYQPKSKQELGFSPSEPLAVSVGRLIPRKGFDVLIKAWREVGAAQLAIIGEGHEEHKLKEMVADFGLSEKVYVMGRVTEEKKWQVLGAADMYVSAARHEGFGIVFLEAMECGLPIVATRVGGQTDFLKSDENALFVPADDEGALAAVINQLTGDELRRKRLGDNNKKEVAHYYLEETTKRFEDVIDEAVSGRSKN